MAQRTVDIHNHLYPKDYLTYLACARGSGSGRSRVDRILGKNAEELYNLPPMASARVA